jgi:hypothetical protein
MQRMPSGVSGLRPRHPDTTARSNTNPPAATAHPAWSRSCRYASGSATVETESLPDSHPAGPSPNPSTRGCPPVSQVLGSRFRAVVSAAGRVHGKGSYRVPCQQQGVSAGTPRVRHGTSVRHGSGGRRCRCRARPCPTRGAPATLKIVCAKLAAIMLVMTAAPAQMILADMFAVINGVEARSVAGRTVSNRAPPMRRVPVPCGRVSRHAGARERHICAILGEGRLKFSLPQDEARRVRAPQSRAWLYAVALNLALVVMAVAGHHWLSAAFWLGLCRRRDLRLPAPPHGRTRSV